MLVARACASTLKEVSHTHDELSVIGLQHQHLAINGVLPPFAGENDPLAQSILAREEKALQAMPDNLANLPRSQLYLKPFNWSVWKPCGSYLPRATPHRLFLLPR